MLKLFLLTKNWELCQETLPAHSRTAIRFTCFSSCCLIDSSLRINDGSQAYIFKAYFNFAKKDIRVIFTVDSGEVKIAPTE